MIQEAVLQFKSSLINNYPELSDFQGSDGLLKSLKKRHNISLKAINGESKDVLMDIVADFKQKIPILCQGYALENIFKIKKHHYFIKHYQIRVYQQIVSLHRN